MFVVGLGFDRAGFGANAKGVAAVSLAGMAAPFLLAVLLAPWLLGMPGLCTPAVTRLKATLFLGAAMPSPPIPCWRASSTNADCPARGSAPCACRRARSTTRARNS